MAETGLVDGVVERSYDTVVTAFVVLLFLAPVFGIFYLVLGGVDADLGFLIGMVLILPALYILRNDIQCISQGGSPYMEGIPNGQKDIGIMAVIALLVPTVFGYFGIFQVLLELLL